MAEDRDNTLTRRTLPGAAGRTLMAGVLIALTLEQAALGAPASAATPNATRSSGAVEEILIARSLRLARGAPTEACAATRTGFKADYEDRYVFQAPVIAGGRMTDTMGTKAGTGHGCLDSVTNPAVANFYLYLQLGEVALRGRGDCRRGRIDFPETGLTTYRCYVELSDPSGRYAGGLLTTNTMTSRNVLGAASDPAGYAQPSIATIRLWKKPISAKAPP